ncbi:MAG: hypothetical protein AAGD35_06120 [Actinomycetota bacterium]
MWERFDACGLDRSEGVEQMCELDPARLGGEPEVFPVGVERPALLRCRSECVDLGGGEEALSEVTIARSKDQIDDVAIALLD